MTTDLTQADIDILEEAAAGFGSGAVNLGKDEDFFNLSSMTLSITFRVDELGGYQTLLNNHTKYSVVLRDETLIVGFANEDGPNLKIHLDNAITTTGWHDVQVVLDDEAGTFEVVVDGETKYLETQDGLSVGDYSYWDVTAGGTPWGRELNGEIADVTVVDEAVDINPEDNIVERMESVKEAASDESSEEEESTETTEETVEDAASSSEAEVVVEEDTQPDASQAAAQNTEVDDQDIDALLQSASNDFGEGVVNLGKDEKFFGMTSMTLGITFRVDEIDGYQTLLNNHKRYSVVLNDEKLIIGFNNPDGPNLKLYFKKAVTETGWHDIHVVLDEATGVFEVWVDGENLYSEAQDGGLAVGDVSKWKVTAGGTPWGRELDGAIADVSIVDEAIEIDPDMNIAERMQYLQALEAGEDPVDPGDEVPSDGGETPGDGGETPGDGGETPGDGGETPGDGGETPVPNTEATFSGDSTGEVTEDGDLTTEGKLDVTDPDAGEAAFEAMSDVGDYGSFSIDEDGNWTYTANDSAALQALDSGDVVTETFTVQSVDGTTTEVKINVNGQDEPVDPGDTGGGNSGGGNSGGEDPTTPPKGVIEVSNSSELADALSGDVAGYVIKLSGGGYDLTLRDLNFSENVTITSADPNNPAHFESLELHTSSNITFDNLEFSSYDTASGSWGESLFKVRDSSNIEISNSTFGNSARPNALNEGFTGLAIARSTEVTLSNNEFFNLSNGAGIGSSSNLTIIGNEFHDIRADGFTFNSVQDVLIEGNSFTDFFHQPGDHSDYIQFWTPSGKAANENIIIRDNIMTQGEGTSTQGIFMTSGDSPTKNVLIENNIIYQSGFHGITVSGGEDIQVLNNTVVSPPDTDTGHTVWIRLSNSDGVIEGNIANSVVIAGDSNVTESNNIRAKIDAETGVYSYDDVFVNTLARYSDQPGDFIVSDNFDMGADTDVFLYKDTNFAGSSAANTINGTENADIIFGFGGDDKLFGFGGDDTMYGGLDDDEMSGGAGSDVLIGGGGSDTLTGDEGSDVFKYTDSSDSGLGSANRDVITDFDATNGDKLSFEGLASADFEYDFDDNTKVLSVDLDGDLVMDMEIELIGVAIDDLDSSDFLI